MSGPKIPYGYRIRDGIAEPDPVEHERLRDFFAAYLDGRSVREAAGLAGIDRSEGCCRRILSNPVYLGDEYYPPLLSRETLQAASARAEERGRRQKGNTFHPVRAPVPVHTRFHRVGTAAEVRDPEGDAVRMYEGIAAED